MECKMVNNLFFIVLNLLFFVGLMAYVIFIFIIKRDFNISRIIIFILLTISFICNIVKFF